MSNEYLGCTRAELLKCLTEWKMKLLEKPDADGLKVIGDELELIKTALAKAEDPTATETKLAVSSTADFKAMEAWFRDSVSKFQPGGDVTIFLSSLENGYRLCVTAENKLESQFVKLAITKLSAEYSNSFLKSGTDTTSYAAFTKYLKDNYSTKETVFQVLQHMWEIERKPDEDIHSLGVRFQEKAAETSTRITAMFEDKVNENKLSGAQDRKMSAADVFMLVGAMQLFQHIRSREPETYKLLVREMDGVYTPADLSKAAKLYTDRLDKTDPASQSGVYLNSNRDQKSSQDSNSKTECFMWRDKGFCYRGDNCKYFHDARHKKKDAEDKPPREDSRPRKSKKSNRGNGNRGKNTSNQGGANVSQPSDTNATSNFSHVSREVFQLP